MKNQTKEKGEVMERARKRQENGQKKKKKAEKSRLRVG